MINISVLFPVFRFPVERQHALSCVWIETGNPRQPLTRVWIDRDMRAVQTTENTPVIPEGHWQCA